LVRLKLCLGYNPAEENLMPYCRRCGTRIDDDACFCYRCGTPVDPYVQQVQPTYQPYPSYQQVPPPPTKPVKPFYKDTVIIVAIGLVALLLTAVVIAAFMVAPLTPWSYTKSLSDENQDIDTLNLNFHSNVGKVTVMTLKIGESRNVLISVQANGTYGALGGSGDPVSITFDNQTKNGTLTLNSQVHLDDNYIAQSNVAIQIFVDPALKLNLNVSSTIGQVSFVADKPTTIQSLSLMTTTGYVEASLQSNVAVVGDLSLKATTGNVDFRIDQNTFTGNRTINLQSTTGSVTVDLTQTKTFSGNLKVDTVATTGSVNVGVTIDFGVAAKIDSHSGAFGDIQSTMNNFSGNNTAMQSVNYPSNCNIEITNRVNAGNIYIDANYQTNLTAS
jgi:predicted membrane protein